MVNIAICDDEIKIVKSVEEILLNLEKIKMIDIRLRLYTNTTTILDDINEGDHFDLIYLDIEMGEENGITVAKRIREYDKDVLFIYISNHEKYLKELLEVEPFRFLSKPIDQELFSDYFLAAINKILNNELYYHFKFNKEYYKVPIKEIMYFESQGRIIVVHLSNGTNSQFYGRLNDIEKKIEELTAHFLRIHQSFFINYKYIKRLAFTEIELFNGETFHISIERQKKIRTKVCELLGAEG